MSAMYFTKEHEWVCVEDGVGTCGITDYAQSQLGDVVFVELPEPGRQVTRGGDAAVVESVKAASEVYAPVSGEVVDANAALPDAPGLVNQAPMGEGWFMRIRLSNPDELAALMDEAGYKAYLATLS